MVPQMLRLSRRLCTNLPSPLSSLPAQLHREAVATQALLSSAQEACATAAVEGSDEIERAQARALTKAALERYVSLVARGSPPVQLSPMGGGIEGEEKEDWKETVRDRNDVMRALGEDVHRLRTAVFQGNRPRVWMGWRGWF